MAYRYEVEVTLSSAKDLKNTNWRYGPIRPYVVLWVDPDRKVTSRTDDKGDTCPQWDQTLIVPVDRPVEEATLYIDVVHHGSADEDTKPLIGTTKLDLIDVGVGARITRSLKLKRPSGRPHGKLELEIMVRDSRYRESDSYPVPQRYRESDSSDSYPVPQRYRESDSYPIPQHVEYEYGAPPYGQPPAYGQQGTPYGNPGYGQPNEYGYGYEYEKREEKKKSGFGGMGTGLAIGAVAGIVGGVALAEGFDQLEDHIVDEAAEQVEDDLGGDDDD